MHWLTVLAAAWMWAVSGQEVVFNEIMPSDTGILADEDGEFSGWIELHNPGSEPVSLEGYGLSDDPTRPFTWIFPQVTIEPGGFLIVFASGKNRSLLSGPDNVDPSLPLPIEPSALPGLLLWLDAADSDSVIVTNNQVAAWQDRSGRSLVVQQPEPISPDAVPGLRLWLDASDLSTLVLENGAVVNWADKSTNLAQANQPVSWRRPALATDSPSGLPVVRFDGYDDFLGFPRLTNVMTVLWVAREDTNATDTARVVLGDTLYYDLHRGYHRTLISIAPDVGAVIGKASAWYNGERVDPLTAPLPNTWAVISLSSLRMLRANTLGTDRMLEKRFWRGDIAEVLVYDSALGDEQRARIEQYLIAKWRPPIPPLPFYYHALQEEPAFRPVHTNDMLSGLPVIRFDGVDDCLRFPRISQTRTLLWVGREDAGAPVSQRALLGDSFFYDLHRGDERIIYSISSASKSVVEGITRLSGEVVDAAATRLPWTFTMLETESKAVTRANTVGSDRLGEDRFWAGDVAELVLYDRVLSETDRQSLESHLAAKWRLPTRFLHTSFQIDPSGEWLLLTAPDGRTVSYVPPLAVREELAAIRQPGGEFPWLLTACPTPGRPNTSEAFPEACVDPTIRPTGGFFSGSVTVTVETNSLPGAVWYTLDGSEPTGPPSGPSDIPWLDEPVQFAAAMAAQGGDDWMWITNDPPPFSGVFSHQSALVEGMHQHYFIGAAKRLEVLPGDSLIAYVYLNPDAPPRQLMLQWHANNWEHRAYWGEDLMKLGTNGTPSCFFMGDMPPAGAWARLETPASYVALEDATLMGMAFACYDGQATWDFAGKSTTQPGSSRLYVKPITISTNAVVRARAFAPGMLPSRTVTSTYIRDEPNALPVISLVTEPAGFFDNQTGIYAKGPGAAPSLPYYGANFWKNWERKVHIELFEPDGQSGFKVDAGVKIHGAWSRSAPQKSLRVHARRKYGAGKIRHPIFPGLAVDEFDTLILRNSGNDWPNTMFRDAFIQSLAEGLNLSRQAYRPARLHINGQYWGIHNIRERPDHHFIESHFGVPTDQVDLIENEGSIQAGDSRAYKGLQDFLQASNLLHPAAYAYVTNQIDLDSFLDYQVTEIFCDNRDWPGHNVLCWKRRASSGKWRWILMDMDGGFDIMHRGSANNTLLAAIDPLGHGISGPYATLLLRKLLVNSDFRNRFVNRFADLLNSTFSPPRVIARIDEMQTALAQEIPRHIQRWTPCVTPGWVMFHSVEAWNEEVDVLRRFARERPDAIRRHISDFFSLPGTAALALDVTPAEGGSVTVGTLRLHRADLPWSGVYFQAASVPIEARPAPGYRFAGWTGVAETNALLTWTPSGDLSLKACFEPDLAYSYDDLRPAPYDLSLLDYTWTAFPADTPAGTYPPNMIFRTVNARDPVLATEMDAEWTLPYNLESGSRVLGLDEGGFSFINTAEAQLDRGFLGEALLALRTHGISNVNVSFTSGTVTPGSRACAIRLQYRVGIEGPFRNVPGPEGLPIEYLGSELAGDSRSIGPIPLPDEVLNQPVAHLRWKYHFIPTGAPGPRPELRLDDIHVSAQRRPLLIARLLRPSENLLLAEASGPPAHAVTWLISTNLTDWVAVQTSVLDTGGKAAFECNIEPGLPTCFYRLRSP